MNQAEVGMPIRDAPIREDRVVAYLHSRGFIDAKIIELEPLGAQVQEDLKGFGYGCPVRARFTSGGQMHDLVIRTSRPDPFGHDRRADRVAQTVLSQDNFSNIPRHVQVCGLGVFTVDGDMIEVPFGEPYLLTEYVEGQLYACDLRAIERCGEPGLLDVQRARFLAEYLAALHCQPAPPDVYLRCLRDTVGSGEGIFGIVDNYPTSLPEVSIERLQRIEHHAVAWRWKLKERAERACRTHGDFHPFNLLFRKGVDLSVLDCSRGGVWEPADDLTCLSINYLFFSLIANGRFTGALRRLWDVFWSTYLEQTQDEQMLDVVAPFFAWRALVLACPAWYPSIEPKSRDQLLAFAECLLEGEAFRPDRVDEVLA